MVPKITDFGLSRCLDEKQSQVLTKTVLGTTGYLAPERFQGSGIKPSGDLYSLGIIIMEILTGQKAHQTIEDVFESWTDRLERSQQDTVYGQIRACYEIASNCTQYHPKDRPASAQAIIDRLHEMERIQVSRRMNNSNSDFLYGLFEEIFYYSPTPAQPPSSAYDLVEMKPPLPAKLGPRDVVMASPYPYEMVEVMPYLCLSVVKARDLPTTGDGVLDPYVYVEVKLGNFKGVTRRLEKNANPVWQQLFTVSAAHLQSNQLQVIVKHKHKDVLRDDFVGRVVFDMSDIPNHSPPNSPQWHHLSDAHGERFPQGRSLGKIMLAVCLATKVDEAFPQAPSLSLQELTDTQSKVYYSPKLIYLKVAVIAAHDLVGTKEDRPLANAIAKMQIGSQIRRTRPQGSVNPTWNEEFLFVVSEPFEDQLVVTVEEKVGAGRDEPIGRIIIDMAYSVPRNDLAKSVPSKWFSLSRGSKNKESSFASKILLRISVETTYHVMYESMKYISDLQPATGF
ncbi:hypothetical protein ZWY2020_059396 [Hordeum vulgare]|nr:hypothetical protein ZWY2020_059396 [Hordeum vulgare]